VLASILVLMAQAGGPAMAPAPPAKWGIDYGKDRCVITRAFDSTGGRTVLAIDADPVTGTGSLVLLGHAVGQRDTFGAATIAIMPEGAKLPVRWVGLRSPDGTAGIKIWLDEASWRRMSIATSATINGFGPSPVALPIAGLDRAVQAARTCGRTLLKGWGADPDAMIGSDAARHPIDWIGPQDYPVDALRANAQGTARTITTVDAAGKPTGCRTVVSSGVPSLDAASCRAILSRGVFAPSAQAVRYYYRQVTWAIPYP